MLSFACESLVFLADNDVFLADCALCANCRCVFCAAMLVSDM